MPLSVGESPASVDITPIAAFNLNMCCSAIMLQSGKSIKTQPRLIIKSFIEILLFFSVNY